MTDQTAEEIEVLQEATRLLAGVALRSLDVLGGAVTLPQYRVLAVLADLGKVRSARVADALQIEASTVTRLVDRLEDAGHVRRERDPTNRSAITLHLTPTGMDLVNRVVTWRTGELGRLLSALSAAERTALAGSLTRLIDIAADQYGAIAVHRLPM